MQALYAASALAVLTALGHSILSERLFLRPMRRETLERGVFSGRTAKKLATLMFHFASLCWVGMALSMSLMAWESDLHRSTLVIYAAIFAVAGLGNFWGVGKVHFGGVMLLGATASIVWALLR